MYIALTDRGDLARVADLRARNDAFRSTLRGGFVILSGGILALGRNTQERIIAAAQAFDDFDADDPWDAHDIGDFEITLPTGASALVFFRIKDIACPAGPAQPALLLLLASEW